jgi:hypothetical protein
MTKKGEVRLDAGAVFVAAAAIAKHPGIKAEGLSELCGWRMRHTSKVLTAAKKAGVADVIRKVGGCFWYSPDSFAAAHAQHMLDMNNRSQQAQKLRNERAAMRRIGGLPENEADDAGDAPIRRLVPAGSAGPLPFKCRAVSSVFDLGVA